MKGLNKIKKKKKIENHVNAPKLLEKLLYKEF